MWLRRALCLTPAGLQSVLVGGSRCLTSVPGARAWPGHLCLSLPSSAAVLLDISVFLQIFFLGCCWVPKRSGRCTSLHGILACRGEAQDVVLDASAPARCIS